MSHVISHSTITKNVRNELEESTLWCEKAHSSFSLRQGITRKAPSPTHTMRERVKVSVWLIWIALVRLLTLA